MTDNEEQTEEPVSRLATLGSVLANWRDWNLPVKLAAVTIVPVIFAIVLGAMQIADQVDRAGSYRRVDRIVVVNEELRGLVAALQRERTEGAVLLAARSDDIETELRATRGGVDSAQDGFTRAAGRVTLDQEIAAARYAEVRTWLAELPGVREQVSGSLLDATTALSRYTEIIEALLRFDRALSAETIDPALVSASTALHDLEAIGEQVRFQHALVGVGLVRGGLVGGDLAELRASAARFDDSVTAFHAVAGERHSQSYDRIAGEREVAGRANLVRTIVANPPGTPIPTTAREWTLASEAASNGIAAVADVLGKQLRDRSAALQDEASDGAGLAAVILLVALVVAIGVMFVVGRHLLRSLSQLRRSALDVAEQGLPAAVARIRDRGEDAASITLDPVPVNSLDEVGQVARAFDAVQRQALRLATEQAGLRAQYSSVFVNLSRRSQGLVQRQLHLLERLERDEEDADQLATLFQLDHLATRMRRNNENLMVLSGSDVGRRNQRPAALADLLRASVSEIEQYQRVVMLPPPDLLVVGYAVGDLVRLVAELLDNATAFSAPDTSVTIASHSFEDGSVCVAVLDDGIGMSQAELDEANAKLADSASIDVSTSRRMGLFVIGRLAGRHGIEVRLNAGSDITGVRATVTVPPDLVDGHADGPPIRVPERAPSRAVPPSGALVPFAPSEVNGSAPVTNGSSNGANGSGHGNGSANGLWPGSLPRRTPAGNGADLAHLLGGDPSTQDTGAPVGTTPDGDAGDDTPDGNPDEGHAPAAGPERRRVRWDGGAGPAAEDDRPPADHAAAEEPGTGDAWPDAEAGEDPADATVATGRPDDGAAPDRSPDDTDGDEWRPAPGTGEAADDDPAGRPAPGEGTDRMPLPRRSPGTAPVLNSLGPFGIARPRAPLAPADGLFSSPGAPGETPPPAGAPPAPTPPSRRTPAGGPPAPGAGPDRPGPGLFVPPARPGGGWWTPRGPGTPVDPQALAETTPIFDEMVSAWFRAVTDAPADGPPPAGPAPGDEPWRFSADAGFTAARAASQAEPAEFTDNGLPRRRPRQNLVPGSVAETPPPLPSRSGRAAEGLRSRLSDYRHGVRRARDHQDAPDPAGRPEDWRFAADAGRRTAEAVSASAPADFTAGGLPRRTPLDNLVPGSVEHAVAPALADGRPRIDRAEELRGRLGSFQLGLSRGRRSLAERAHGPTHGVPETEQQESE